MTPAFGSLSPGKQHDEHADQEPAVTAGAVMVLLIGVFIMLLSRRR